MPRRRALIHALDNRTREYFEGDDSMSHLDYVVEWVESGKTLRDLVRQLGKEAGIVDMLPAMLTNYLRREWPEAPRRLQEARRHGAHLLVEEAVDISDDTVESAAEAAQARNRMSSRHWMAERYNRDELGGSKAPAVQVNLGVGDLHLAALRARAFTSLPDQAVSAEVLPPATEPATLPPGQGA